MTRSWSCLLLLLALGCTTPPEEPAVDHDAERLALMNTDQAWFESHEDLDEFITHLADDAVFMPAGAPAARGDDIRAAWEGLLEAPGFDLVWQAESAHIAEDGDLGYTLGTYQLTMEQEGTPMVTQGKYVTLWEKQPDGTRKVVVDCFNAGGPPTAA